MKKWILLLLTVLLAISRLSAAETPTTHLIILPGLGCPGDMYKDLGTKLGTGVTLHTLPWTQIVTQGNESQAPEALVLEALKTYVDDHAIQQFVLTGHSMGGWMAMQLARTMPERISSLIIIDAVPFSAGLYQDLSPEQALAQSQQITQVLGSMGEKQYRTFEGQRLSLMSDDPERQKQIGVWFAAVPKAFGIRLMALVTASDLRQPLSRIQVPTLVLASAKIAGRMGMNPAVFEERLRKQFSNMPKYDLYIAPTAGHFIMLDEPAWLAERVTLFLEAR